MNANEGAILGETDTDMGTGKGVLAWQRIPPRKRRSVVFAAVLTCLGLGMVISGLVLWRTEGTSALIGLWVCGVLVLIPGIYFLRIAYHLCRQGNADGYYAWSDIPDVM